MHPELTHLKVISKMGEIWNKLSDLEKQEYFDESLQDKARFEKEKNEYDSRFLGNRPFRKKFEPNFNGGTSANWVEEEMRKI